MTCIGRFGGDGVLRLHRPFSRAALYTVEEERGWTACHIRNGSGEYLATLERDGRVRESLIFNVYKGSVRTGTMAAAPRAENGLNVLPAVSLSWGKRSFDGFSLTAPVWESEGTHRRGLAVLKRTPGGWRLRMTAGAGPGDECDALLTLAAAEVWVRMKQRQGGGAL